MLKNMTALVTGGLGGLGLPTARKLLKEGCKVMVLDKESTTAHEKLKDLGTNILYSSGDITCDEDVIKTLDQIKHNFEKLDVIVNCAGVTKARMFYNFNKNKCSDISFFRDTLNVNLLGTINVIRFGAGLMANNTPDEDGLRGVIINTGGLPAYDGQIGQTALALYCGAIESLSLPLARELGLVGIRVMNIAPGVMKTPLNEIIPEKILTSVSSFTPCPKRLGLPEEFAETVVSIIKNRFLNAETIRLDGGLRLYMI